MTVARSTLNSVEALIQGEGGSLRSTATSVETLIQGEGGSLRSTATSVEVMLLTFLGDTIDLNTNDSSMSYGSSNHLIRESTISLSEGMLSYTSGTHYINRVEATFLIPATFTYNGVTLDVTEDKSRLRNFFLVL